MRTKIGIIALIAVLIAISGCEEDCETNTWICATLDGSGCEESVSTVYICPGEDVYLQWYSTDDVTSATLSPNEESVNPTDSKIVNPTDTTDYTISVKGSCCREAKLTVVVIKEGVEIEINANPIQYQKCWEFYVPETICSKRIVVTSIAPVCGLGCFVQAPPIENYPYLECGDLKCNGLWSGIKVDHDGHIHGFNTQLGWVNLPNYKFVGTWQFGPLRETQVVRGQAYFNLKVKC